MCKTKNKPSVVGEWILFGTAHFIFVHLNVCFRKCQPERQCFQHQEDPRTSKDSNSVLLNNCQDYHWYPIWDFSVHVLFGIYGILQVGTTAKWLCHVLCWRPFNCKLLVSIDCGAVFVKWKYK